MIKANVLLTLSGVALWAQTTVYLREGGHGSTKAIVGISTTTPIVLTVPAHGFADGDTVWVSLVRGNTAANGVRKVAYAGVNSFSLTDLNGVNIASSGTAIDQGGAVYGYVGKAFPHALVGHPRLMLDGPSGPLASILKDPDGYGGTTSTRAQPGFEPWEAVKRWNDLATAGVPGALWKSYASPYLADSLALGWYMDNSQANWLATLKSALNNIDKFILAFGNTANFGGCLYESQSCGHGDAHDQAAFQSAYLARAYTIVRDQLTSEERSSLLDKVLNDTRASDYSWNWDNSRCVNNFIYLPGMMIIRAGSNQATLQGATLPPAEELVGKTVGINNGSGYAMFANVVSRGSDTQLTLDGMPAYGSTTTAGASWGIQRPWQPGDCGLIWNLQFINNFPNTFGWTAQTTVASDVGATDTTIRLSSMDDIAQIPPYYLNVTDRGSKAEWLLVTSEDRAARTATVIRGQLGTSAQTFRGGNDPAWVFWTPHPTAGMNSGSPWHNLTWARTFAMIQWGLALADDDPRAAKVLEAGYNYFYDFTYPYLKGAWTGFNQGGGNYGHTRWNEWVMTTVLMMKNSVSPSIDLSDGNWLKMSLDMFPQESFGWDSSDRFAWGDVNTDTDYQVHHTMHIPLGLMLYPDSNEAKRAYFWWRDYAKLYAALSGDVQNSAIPLYALAAPGEASGQARQDFKSDPTYALWTSPDWGNGYPLVGALSRTHWGPSATQVAAAAFSNPNDHLGSYPGPADYRIAKGQPLLSPGAPAGFAGFCPSCTNYVEIGGTNNLRTYSINSEVQLNTIEKSYGSSLVTYVRFNTTQAYRSSVNVKQAYRHVLHLKGNQDLVVSYDDVRTNGSQQKRITWNYYSDQRQTPVFTANTGACAASFTRVQAKLETRLLLPAAVTCTTNSFGADAYDPKKFKINQLIQDAGTTAASNFLAVHKAFLDLSAAMPPASVIPEVSTTHDGVQVAGGYPAVAVFPKNSAETVQSLNLRTTHESTGLYFAAGLQAGWWRITRAGAILTVMVGEDNTATWYGPSGTYALAWTDTTDAVITTRDLPAGYEGDTLGPVTLTNSSGAPPFTYSAPDGTPPGVTLASNGVLFGTFPAAGIHVFRARLTDASGVGTDTWYALRSQSTTPVIYGQSLPTRTSGSYLYHRLFAEGGRPPLTWTQSSGSPPGIQFRDGLYSGTAATGSYSWDVTVTDSEGRQATKALTGAFLEGPAITLATLSFKEGEAVNQSVTHTGGQEPVSCALGSSGVVPEGLVIDGANCVLKGVPAPATGGRAYDFRVFLSDADGAEVSQQYTGSVGEPGTVRVTESSPVMPNPKQNNSYSHTLEASGCGPSCAWSLAPGYAAPAGLTLSPAGLLSGTPTVRGNTVMAVTANNGVDSYTKILSITVDPDLAIEAPPAKTITPDDQWQDYDLRPYTFGQSPAAVWSTTNISFPPSCNWRHDGRPGISWLHSVKCSPGTQGGVYQTRISVVDGAKRVDAVFSWYVNAPRIPPTIRNASIGPLTTMAGYMLSLDAAGGVEPYQWGIESGRFPEGMTLSVTGLLSGVPTVPGTWTVTVTVSDYGGGSASKTFTIVVNPPPNMAGGTVGTCYVGDICTLPIPVAGGTAPLAWSLIDGSLPAGMQLLPAGVLMGRPSEAGSRQFRARVRDVWGMMAEQELSLVVAPAEGSKGLTLQVLDAVSGQLVARYGQRGLATNTPCRLEASLTPVFSAIMESIDDAGGASSRQQVLGTASPLAPDQVYFLRAACGAQTATSSARTSPSSNTTPAPVALQVNQRGVWNASTLRLDFGRHASLGSFLSEPCRGRCLLYPFTDTPAIWHVQRSYLNQGTTVRRSGVWAGVAR